jgi:HK97 family phage prohead protease
MQRPGSLKGLKPMAKPKLAGYAAVFDLEANIAGEFRECIARGAFTAAIGRDDVRALFNHSPDFVLGRTTAGTLRLSEDSIGLRYEIDPPDTQWARDLIVSVERGEVKQSSFAFNATDEEWVFGKRGELPLRIVRAARLWDVSPVVFPAYEGTSAFVTRSGHGSMVFERHRLALAERGRPSIAVSRTAPRSDTVVNPTIAAMRLRIAAAERGESLAPPRRTAPAEPALPTPPAWGLSDGYRVPKLIRTRY